MLMDRVLGDLTFKGVLCYMDDLLVTSPTIEEHLSTLQLVLDRLKKANLKLNAQKSKFAVQKCKFLGHVISTRGLELPPDKLEVIRHYPEPKGIRDVRQLMGLFNWFRKFIPNMAVIARPINKLLRKDVKFCWSCEQQDPLDELKRLVLSSPVLAFPRWELPFRLAGDTSSHGVGYMLYQVYPPEELPPGTTEKDRSRVVRFGSKLLKKWQQSYGPTKLELLGITLSILDCAPYLRQQRFTVECDHQALKPIMQKQMRGALYERWLGILQQFNFDIVWKSFGLMGVNASATARAADMIVPDALSRCHPNDKFGPSSESPDEQDPLFPYVTRGGRGCAVARRTTFEGSDSSIHIAV